MTFATQASWVSAYHEFSFIHVKYRTPNLLFNRFEAFLAGTLFISFYFAFFLILIHRFLVSLQKFVSRQALNGHIRVHGGRYLTKFAYFVLLLLLHLVKVHIRKSFP